MLGARPLPNFIHGVALLALTACVGAQQRFPLSTPLLPHTHGSVQIEQLQGGQHLLVVQLDELPPPDALSPSAATFVVWVHPREQAPVRAGALRYDRAARSGTLMTTVSSAHFTVRVTSEADADIDQPSDVLVAEQAVAFN